MSRIGNNPIIIPEGVSVEIQPNLFSVKGKLGELSQPYDLVSVEQTDNTLTLKRENESKWSSPVVFFIRGMHLIWDIF